MEFLANACSSRGYCGTVPAMKAARLDDLKKIYLVQQLAENQSLSKTARAQKVTPSAISQSIKSLETSLGYPVIIRNGEDWILTEKGNSLLEKTKSVFDVLTQTFGYENEPFTLGSLAFGTYESLAIEFVPILSETIKRDFPTAKLSFVTSRSRDLIKKVQSGELCTALIVRPDELPTGFMEQKIFSDSLGIFGMPELAKKFHDDSNGIIMGSMAPGTDGHPLFYKKFLKANSHFKPNFLCDSFEVLKGLVSENRAIAVLPVSIAKKTNLPLVNLAEKSKDIGHHDISLIASETCDQREFAYLGNLFKRIEPGS